MSYKNKTFLLVFIVTVFTGFLFFIINFTQITEGFSLPFFSVIRSDETKIDIQDLFSLTGQQDSKVVKNTLSGGENVYVRGLGYFVIKKRAKKIGRHIKKKKSIEIPEHFIPSFKPAKVFVEQVKANVHSLPEDEGDDD